MMGGLSIGIVGGGGFKGKRNERGRGNGLWEICGGARTKGGKGLALLRDPIRNGVGRSGKKICPGILRGFLIP